MPILLFLLLLLCDAQATITQVDRPAPKPDATAIKIDWHPSILDAGKEVAVAAKQVVTTGRQIERTAVQLERTGAAVEKLATASERAITVATDYGPMVFVVCACIAVAGLVVLWGRKPAATRDGEVAK